MKNIPDMKIKGTSKGGKETLSNKTKEFNIIPIAKLNNSEGIKTKRDSRNNILFNDLLFAPIALIIKKSLAFCITPAFW